MVVFFRSRLAQAGVRRAGGTGGANSTEALSAADERRVTPINESCTRFLIGVHRRLSAASIGVVISRHALSGSEAAVRPEGGRSQAAFALALFAGLQAPFRDLGEPAVEGSQRRGIERRAVGVGCVAEIFQPGPSQFRLVVGELVDESVERHSTGRPCRRGKEFAERRRSGAEARRLRRSGDDPHRDGIYYLPRFSPKGRTG